MKKTISCLAAGTFVTAMLIWGPSAKASARAPITAAPVLQAYGSPQQGYYPNEQWAVPNSQWQAAEQKGFREGVRGAHKDAENHRQPNVENRDEFRHPDRDDIPGDQVGAYREGFKRGYWAGVRHLMGYYSGPNPYQEQNYDQQYGQPEQGYYPSEQWAVPPSQWQAAEQKGFREGVRGAYKDAQNHRQPNVENRDEYRNPDRDDIPGDQVGAYREGFQRGYWTGVRHLMGYYSGPNPYQEQNYDQQYGQPEQGYYPNEQWAVPPSDYQAVQQRGFRDGVRGAYKDAQNHRPPNVENRDEYRHPDDVSGQDREIYRDAFRRGYWTGVRHLMGYYHGDNPDYDRR